MVKQVQIRRGTTVENDMYTGAQGELTMDTEKKELRLHDGVTQGGNKVPVLVAVQRPTAENNYTWYRKWSDGWVEQGGCYTASNTTQPSAYKNTITFAIPFADTNYTVSAIGWSSDDSSYYQDGVFESSTTPRTTTTFTVDHESFVTKFNLMACGMAA